MHLRVIKNIGSYKCDQRLKMDNFYARQLIAVGIAVEDTGEEQPAYAYQTAEFGSGSGLPPEETPRKRRYRRRDLTADE